MVRVIEFSASITRACTLRVIWTTYGHMYGRTDQPMPSALCFVTLVPRQKYMAWIACTWVSHNSTYLHVCNYLMVELQSHQLNLICWVYSHQTWLTHWKCNDQKLWIVLSQYWMTVQSRYSKAKYYLLWNTYNSGV